MVEVNFRGVFQTKLEGFSGWWIERKGLIEDRVLNGGFQTWVWDVSRHEKECEIWLQLYTSFVSLLIVGYGVYQIQKSLARWRRHTLRWWQELYRRSMVKSMQNCEASRQWIDTGRWCILMGRRQLQCSSALQCCRESLVCVYRELPWSQGGGFPGVPFKVCFFIGSLWASCFFLFCVVLFCFVLFACLLLCSF